MLDVRKTTEWVKFKAAYDRFQACPSELNKRSMKEALKAWESEFLGEGK